MPREYDSTLKTDRVAYLEMRREIGDNTCDVCGGRNHVCIDYDSLTNVIRGLICISCFNILHRKFNDELSSVELVLENATRKPTLKKTICDWCGKSAGITFRVHNGYVCRSCKALKLNYPYEKLLPQLVDYLKRTSYKEKQDEAT